MKYLSLENYWFLSDLNIRLECTEDKVLAKETVVTCTPLGWASAQGLGTADIKIPECKPNVCPNLMDKVMNKGEWECRKQNTSKTCKNHRIGELCMLKCEDNFKVTLR